MRNLSFIIFFAFFIVHILEKASASQQETLRVSAYLSPLSHSVKNIIEPWMDRVSKATGNRVEFDTYWGGGLGRNPYKQFDLVKAGVTQVTLVQPSYTPGQFPQLQVLELPFMYRSSTEASILAWKLYENGLLTGFDEVKLIGLWTAEPSNLFTRNGIRKYSEISGLKIRSVGRLEGDFLQMLGAVPEAMHPSDAVEALRRGTMDAVIQGWIALNTFQTYRETDYVITAPLGTVSFAILMNRSVWDSLSPSLQKIIEENSGINIAMLGGEAYDRRQKEISKRLGSEGHLDFIQADSNMVEEMKEFVSTLALNWIERTPGGQETYDAVESILKDIRYSE